LKFEVIGIVDIGEEAIDMFKSYPNKSAEVWGSYNF